MSKVRASRASLSANARPYKKLLPKPTSPPQPPLLAAPRHKGIYIATGIAVYAFTAYGFYLYATLLAEPDHPLPYQDTDVADRYHNTAKHFDADVSATENIWGITRLRRRLATQAKGDVLEVSVGTGRNGMYYDVERVKSLAFVDQSRAMVEIARKKWNSLHPEYERCSFHTQSAMDPLPSPAMPKTGFTTIVQTMGICSTPTPAAMLAHLGSLTDPDNGKLLLLEHGRSYYDWMNWILDKAAAKHADKHGCWFNRDVGKILEESGLVVEKVERSQFGTLWFVEARPGDGGNLVAGREDTKEEREMDMASREPQNSARQSERPKIRHQKRSRSPHNHVSHKHKRSKPSCAPVHLPFQSPTLHKHDFEASKPMFELYLDIQKQKVLEELPDDEVKGRWKSFVGKWNRGELAEGWYDPATLQKAQASSASNAVNTERRSRPRDSPNYGSPRRAEDSSDEDAVGPAMPGGAAQVYKSDRKAGPSIPNLQDLELQRELEQDDSLAHRQELREHRHLDRKQQKERLDELVPRAEAGSKDRMLEKKREKADSNRAFASAKVEAGGVEEVPESDLLGDDDGGIEGFKKQKREMDRKKNERELRREELARARMEELEERRREYRAKEEKTMSGLVALAKSRFG